MPRAAFLALAVTLVAAAPRPESPTMTQMTAMKRLTPIVFVEAIEPCLSFWTDWLGFEVTVTVPEEDRLGFVILERESLWLMYQTRASVANDVPALLDDVSGGATTLFIEVESLNRERDRLLVDWGRLQIEQSMWGTHPRIESLARERLNLNRPVADDVIVVAEPNQ